MVPMHAGSREAGWSVEGAQAQADEGSVPGPDSSILALPAQELSNPGHPTLPLRASAFISVKWACWSLQVCCKDLMRDVPWASPGQALPAGKKLPSWANRSWSHERGPVLRANHPPKLFTGAPRWLRITCLQLRHSTDPGNPQTKWRLISTYLPLCSFPAHVACGSS